MLINFGIIIAAILCAYCIDRWFNHVALCADVSAKNKVSFFEQAEVLLLDGGLNNIQKEKIYKWADTIESKSHANYLFMAIIEIYSEIKSGRNSTMELEQEENYTDDMARLFTFWMFAQAYSIPLVSRSTMTMLDYIVTAKRSDKSIDIEVNKDLFRQDEMICAAA